MTSRTQFGSHSPSAHNDELEAFVSGIMSITRGLTPYEESYTEDDQCMYCLKALMLSLALELP